MMDCKILQIPGCVNDSGKMLTLRSAQDAGWSLALLEEDGEYGLKWHVHCHRKPDNFPLETRL